MDPLSPTVEKPSFWQEWRQLIVFFAAFAALIIGIYFWSERQFMQPIDPVYAAYIEQLAQASPKAQRYQDKYFQHSNRSTVASQDFLMVCAGMTQAAKTEDIDPAKFSKNLAALCENESIYINQDFFR